MGGRGTKDFKVFLGDNENGPWTEVLSSTLPDPIGIDETIASAPLAVFGIEPKCAKFVKFKIMTYYGAGGGLQYFSTCPLKCEEDGWVQYLNKCYKLFEPEADYWTDANENCWKIRAQLPSIANADINTFVRSLSPSKKIYIGGMRMMGPNQPNTFAWIDGTPFIYTNWRPGSPDNKDQFCMELLDGSQNGKFNDLPCFGIADAYNFVYVCEKYSLR